MDDEQRKRAIIYANRLGYVLLEVVPGEAEIVAILRPDDSMNVVVIWRSPDSAPTESVIRSTFKISSDAVESCLLTGFEKHDDRCERRLGEVIVERLAAHSSSVAKEQRGELVIWQLGVEELRA